MSVHRSVRPRRQEIRQVLPGDDLIPRPAGILTHAITIHRPAAEIWPWLVQMGGGRAGWYSYDRIDNGGEASAEQIVPRLQQVGIGEVFPGKPGLREGFVLLRFEPGRYLILGWPAPDGRPIVTWAFVLQELGPGTTRLIVRVRGAAGYRPPFGLPQWAMKTLVPVGHWLMQRTQLLGIARRAEAVP